MQVVSAAGRPVIVVGVDGSEPSREALRWAVRQAGLTGAEVRAPMAWHLPVIYGYAPSDYEVAARNALNGAVEQALDTDPSVLLTPGRRTASICSCDVLGLLDPSDAARQELRSESRGSKPRRGGSRAPGRRGA
jgi:nucleotide-binding universal stress UspA family protein